MIWFDLFWLATEYNLQKKQTKTENKDIMWKKNG